MIHALIYLIIIGVVAWLATYILSQFPPPDPLGRVLRVAILVIAIIAAVIVVAGAFGINLRGMA